VTSHTPQAAVSTPRPPLPERLEALGPMWPRVAHHLATRPDVLSGADRDRLLLAEARVVPVPWKGVRDALAGAFGRSPAGIFAELHPRPVRVSEIAQVHRGELRDGTVVDVKVIRPGAREAVADAVRRLDLLAGALEGEPEPARVADLIEEIADWLGRQLDLLHELGNLQRLRGLARRSVWEHVPCPHIELCSSEVMVTDAVPGVPLSDVLRPWPSGDRRASLRAHGGDPPRLARVVLTVNLRQAFRYRFFCLDLHPANLIALPDDRIAFADLSSCSALDRTTAEAQLRYLTALVEDEVERTLDPPMDTVAWADEGDVPGFRRALLALGRDRALAAADGAPADPRRPGPVPAAPGELLAGVLAAARRCRVRLPQPGLLLYRSIVAADETARLLDAKVDAHDVSRRCLSAARLDATVRTIEPERVQSTALSVVGLLRDSPGRLHKILSDLADGSFSLNVWVSEVPQLEHNRDRRARLVAAAICATSLAVLLTAPELPRVLGVSVAWFVGSALALLYVWILLTWRRLR
jgi:ubiquinone biosynthesis protein